MKKCLIYGNCQTSAIQHYLKRNSDFTEIYNLIDIKPVHLLSDVDVPYIEKIIVEVDLLIHQHVSDNYKGIHQLSTRHLKDKLKSHCKIISLPVAYFTGYNPEMIHFKSKDGAAISEPFPSPYHDANILRAYMEGRNVHETIQLIKSNDFYNFSYLDNNLTKTLENLICREKESDIKLSDFIRDNFRRNRLFHTFNHPSSMLLAFICNSILDLLELQSDFFSPEEPDVLFRDSFPIYPSLIKHMAVEFTCMPEYRFEHKNFFIQDVIERFFNFYEKNQKIAKENLQSLSNLSPYPKISRSYPT